MTDATTTRIVLKGLEGNAPTHLKGLQLYLAPHLELLLQIWQLVFFAVLMYMLVRHVLMPLFRDLKR